MGKNIKYGEFTFPSSPARPTGMKDGGMCAPAPKYAKGGPKVKAKREPEARVRKEVALLRKAKAPLTMLKHEMEEPTGMKKGGMAQGGQYAAEAPKKMAAEGKAGNKLAKKFGTESQKYAKGGAVEAKLEKHANMPAGKAHGPGAGNKLAKGGVPTFSKVPKIGKMR